MRRPGILLIAFVATAAPAWAQEQQPVAPVAENTRVVCTDGRDNDADAHVDCDDQDCQDFTFCAASRAASSSGAADELARLRGRGVTEIVVGSVLLSLGVVLGATSSALWIEGGHHYGFNAYDQGAVAMEAIGVGMIGAGTVVLAIGAGNLARAKRSRVAVAPTSLAVRF